MISILVDQNPKTCSIVCEFFYDECRDLIKNSGNWLAADQYKNVYETLKLQNLPNFNFEEGLIQNVQESVSNNHSSLADLEAPLIPAPFLDHMAINANEADDEDIQKLNIDKENLYLLSKLGDPELKTIVENN